MVNALARKLELFGPLSDDDRRLLDETIMRPRTVEDHQDIIREGDAPEDVHLVLEGFAMRYKILPDGRRSIFAYLIPGDFCDLNIFILKAMDHGIATLSACTMVDIPRQRILELLERPAIARALWWATLVDEATLREWLVNMGRRNAESSIAHLFCEIHLRLKSIGLADGGEFYFPVTQRELSDTMGLSAVHMNRSLQNLQAMGLLTVRRSKIKIHDIDRLHEMCEFNSNYLHLDGSKTIKKQMRCRTETCMGMLSADRHQGAGDRGKSLPRPPCRETLMPRYFIDTDDGDRLHQDHTGHVLPDTEAARKTALDALPDMARDKIPDGDTRTITATARDEQGNVVYAATLTLKGERGPGYVREG